MGRRIAIIGNGVAGVTAARFIRKMSDDSVTIISGETDHFYARTALMYIYMGQVRYVDTKPYEDWFWSKNGIALVRAWVTEFDVERKQLRFHDGGRLSYDVLLIATGSRPKRGGWPGEDLGGIQGLYGLPDLERMAAATRGVRRAAVVGGGLIGVEMAEMLHSRGIAVSMLVRESSYFRNVLPEEESRLVTEEIRCHGIDVRLETDVTHFESGANERVAAVATTGGTVPAEFVGVTIGVEPNIEVARASGIETGRGVLVNEYLEAGAPDVYAAGDCAEISGPGGIRRIEQLWYTGRKQGFTVAHTICGRLTAYRPGHFFNSAKFFDLEYQTYGAVPAQPQPGTDSVLWQDDRTRRLLRIHFDAASGVVLGFNALGIRLRQQVCEHWLTERQSLDFVQDHLHEAGFDQEFGPRIGRLHPLVSA